MKAPSAVTSTPVNKPAQPQPVLLMPFAPWSRGPGKFKREGSNIPGTSKTIPDDSFTIAELFDRYRKGAPLPAGLERPLQYGDNPSHNDLDLGKIGLMDLADVNDLKKRVSDTLYFLNERKTSLEAQQKAQNEAKNAINAKNAVPDAPPAPLTT